MTRPVFGEDRDPGVVAALQTYPGKGYPKVPLSQRPNPMVVALGPADPARVCGDCRHLIVKHDHGSRRYHGCLLRGPLTGGPGTDHLVRWPACRSFEEREDA